MSIHIRVICILLVAQLMVSGPLFVDFDESEEAIDETTVKTGDLVPKDLDQKSVSMAWPSGKSQISRSIQPSNEDAIGSDLEIGHKASYYVSWWGKWFFNGTDPSEYMTFTKRAQTDTCEVWVADDLFFFEGDPRNLESERIAVSDGQVIDLVAAWELNIFPRLTELVGSVSDHDGSNAAAKELGVPCFPTSDGKRVMIMVFNIADYSFWDPTYPFYGQGYFAPSLIPFYDRNIVHISSYNWKEFLGPANQELPHQTEAILAHEFAHLLGFEQNPFQAAYLTEGISEFSQVYCGYRIHPVLINAYLVQPENSLISGDDYGMMNMADYGAMALFVTYIADHFGSDVVHEIVASGSLGKDAVTRGLMVAGHPSWNFDRVFEKWRLANLIHSHSPGNGWYDYTSLDLSDPVYAAIKSNEYNATNDGWVASAADRFGNSIDVDGWDTGISMLGPYGTDYVHIQGEDLSWLNRPNGVKKFLFDGEDKQVGWQRQATGVLPSTWTLSSEGDVASPWAVVTKDLAKRDFCIAAGPIGKEQGQVAIEVIGDSVGFDTRNRSGLNLSFSFRSYPSYNAPSSVEVLLSTDQGNEYTSVYVVDYWSFFYWTSVTVDIGWATGYEDVRLALRFIDPSYGGDMAMFFFDDIVVQDDKGTTLYSEDFDHFVIDHWWSDYSDLLDTSLICSVDLTRQESATLSIDTWYHIESPYDAGFVQVSVDRGETWTSLSNEYSFSDVGDDILPMILENGPRLNKYFGGPNDWITMDFDLGAYVGEKVMIRFWHVTDSFTPMPDPDMGWNIKDVRINGVSLEPSSFVTAPTHPRNDWMVTVYFPAFMTKNGKEFPAKVVSLNPSERSERTSMLLAQYSMYKEAYIVVSATVGPSDYGFGIGSAFPT